MKNTYTKQKYDFNFIEARDGGLCVVQIGTAQQFLPCIVSSVTLDDKCITRINGTEYIFNKDGSPSNTAAKNANYRLYNGVIDVGSGGLSIEDGTVVENNTKKYTRAASGELTEDTSDPYYQSVSLDSLDVRDQLAVQILSDILHQSGKNPAGFSGYEMGFYCDAAYEWASYFVKAAAQRKIIVEDADTGGGASTRASVSTDSLSSNTEKLLNNISLSLAEHSNLFQDYTAAVPPTGKLGLAHLIEAINNISVDLSDFGYDASQGITQANVLTNIAECILRIGKIKYSDITPTESCTDIVVFNTGQDQNVYRITPSDLALVLADAFLDSRYEHPMIIEEVPSIPSETLQVYTYYKVTSSISSGSITLTLPSILTTTDRKRNIKMTLRIGLLISPQTEIPFSVVSSSDVMYKNRVVTALSPESYYEIDFEDNGDYWIVDINQLIETA